MTAEQLDVRRIDGMKPSRSMATPLAIAALVAVQAIACAPTIRVKVDPITIYAKLDADVRLRLDKDVQELIRQNPNLF